MIDFIKEAGFPAIALLLGGGMVLLAIIKNIALEKVKVQLTSKQSIQLAVVGTLFIIGGFVLQYFPPGTAAEDGENAANADPTLSLLQTQLAQLTIEVDATEQASFPSNPTATIIASQTLTTASSENKTPTPAPLIPTATSSVQSLTELFCANFYSVIVRTGPNTSYPVQSILENLNNLSNPDCLMFDFRMPDNTWLRIAPNQDNSDYSEHELGWVIADQFRPIDFEKLRVYVPESVQNGLYCVTNRYGLNVRTCPSSGCREVGTLTVQDCVIMDGRSGDDQWLRISKDQNDSKYEVFGGNWVSSYFIAPVEFAAGYQPYFRYYFDLLPTINLAPTPQG